MKINDELVQHIAHLARLEFEGDELNEIKGDMSKIIGFMDKLSELDTEDVEPLIFMTDKVNVLRDDKPERTLTSEDALRNAPKKDSDYFRISKVLNKKS
ncbi:MAG: Asp-tRNA(Asn)/Glu-tRNA(Gln) amidotransferase subunit GatC [Bacteroidota bacterium]|nr:Asp-tRNA(Asn)/Glu-tRNA(Gln) amidotransferase subunit GatC [Bacteroidota bacterium]